MAPGPPWKRVSPVKTHPSAGAWKQTAPGRVARRVQRPQHRAPDEDLEAVAEVDVPQVALAVLGEVGEVPQRLVVGGAA